MIESSIKDRVRRTMATWIYAFTMITCLLVTGMAHAQQRWVMINNQLMTDVEVASLERMACTHIPNGNYWVNMNTGAWGFVGNPYPQGRIGDYCHATQPRQHARRKSLSERRMLFSTGDWLR